MSDLATRSGEARPRLAPVLSPGGGSPALRRRGALGLALLASALLGPPIGTGTIGLPERAPAAPAPGRRGAPRAAATGKEPARAKTQAPAAPGTPEARPPSDRVVAPAHAGSLFAQHSWYVLPPAPPPAPPPPPPPPTAPPFPYAFVGSYARGAEGPVFFLARGDRLIEARVGDRLDGVYQFESASDGQLVFVYLPLDIRQTLAAGASR